MQYSQGFLGCVLIKAVCYAANNVLATVKMPPKDTKQKENKWASKWVNELVF